jgi:hypothetical protein
MRPRRACCAVVLRLRLDRQIWNDPLSPTLASRRLPLFLCRVRKRTRVVRARAKGPYRPASPKNSDLLSRKQTPVLQSDGRDTDLQPGRRLEHRPRSRAMTNTKKTVMTGGSQGT